MPTTTLGVATSASSGLEDLNVFMGSGRPPTACESHTDDLSTEINREVEPAPAPLPSDLQGLDDLFLKPLGQFFP